MVMIIISIAQLHNIRIYSLTRMTKWDWLIISFINDITVNNYRLTIRQIEITWVRYTQHTLHGKESARWQQTVHRLRQLMLVLSAR